MNTREQIFLSLMALAGMLVVAAAASTYGMGVSTDSINYISAADSFARGAGFVNYVNMPMVWWPPGYSFVLGALRWATGIRPFASGSVLQVLTVGAVVILAGVLFHRCFRQRRLWFYLGVAAATLSLSLYASAANIGTDVLFDACVLLFLLLAQDYPAGQALDRLLLMALVAAVASLVRYVGGVLALVGLALILLAEWKRPARMLGRGVAYALISLGPILLWILGRNYRLYDTFTGPRIRETFHVNQNLIYAYSKISNWFLPVTITDRAPLFVFLLVLLVGLALVARKDDWLRFLRRLVSPAFLPMWIFCLLYFLAISFLMVTEDHFDYYDDRFYLPLYVPILAFFFLALDELLLAPLRGRAAKIAALAVVAVFAVWAIYPASLIAKFIVKSRQDGVAAYNRYNLRRFQDSQLLAFMRAFPYEQGVPIYSNYPAMVYFYLERRSLASPSQPQRDPGSLDYLLQKFHGWPKAPLAYLIYFNTPDDKRNYYSPHTLKRLADVAKAQEDPDGGFYIIRSR